MRKLFAALLCTGMLAGLMLPIIGCTETKKTEVKPATDTKTTDTTKEKKEKT